MGEVHRRAWRDAKKSVGLETRERVVLFLIIQTLIGTGLWLALGNSALQSTAWGRGLTAGIPFLLLPAVYLWKLPGTPARIAAERAAEINALRADTLGLHVVDHSLTYKPNGFLLNGDPLTLFIRVRNPGSPTIVTNWRLSVLNGTGQVVGAMRVGAAARQIYQGGNLNRTDLSCDPMAAGSEETVMLLVFREDVIPRLVSGQQRFLITCEDVKRRQSTTEYVVDFD